MPAYWGVCHSGVNHASTLTHRHTQLNAHTNTHANAGQPTPEDKKVYARSTFLSSVDSSVVVDSVVFQVVVVFFFFCFCFRLI
jgi:hypothetical protein